MKVKLRSRHEYQRFERWGKFGKSVKGRYSLHQILLLVSEEKRFVNIKNIINFGL